MTIDKLYYPDNIHLMHIEGMELDAQKFWSNQSKIKDFELYKTDIGYLIVVTLQDYSIMVARELFFSFFTFAAYGYFNTSIREIQTDYITYRYITAMDSGQGVHFEIVFNKPVAKKKTASVIDLGAYLRQ